MTWLSVLHLGLPSSEHYGGALMIEISCSLWGTQREEETDKGVGVSISNFLEIFFSGDCNIMTSYPSSLFNLQTPYTPP